MANQVYDNFYLANEIEDQINSYLDLQNFARVRDELEGTAGMTYKVNVYSATSGAEKLELGEGNTKSIEVALASQDYTIELAQNRFEYYDEQAMTDPNLVPVGARRIGSDLYNTMNADIFAEFGKTSLVVSATSYGFNTFVDAVSMMEFEDVEDAPLFALVHPTDMGEIRKALGEDLKYVEAFARRGYVGTVAGVNVYATKEATEGTMIVATRDAVTLFVKTGTEVEVVSGDRRGADDANVRKNTIFGRKYYVAALTDETRAVKITVTSEGDEPGTGTTEGENPDEEPKG